MQCERFSKRYRASILAVVFVLVMGVVAEAFAPPAAAAEGIRRVSAKASEINPELMEKINAMAAKTSRREVEAEVIGGSAVRQGAYRFMAKIFIQTPEGVSNCGGTLIEARYVLTAAHCIMDIPTGEVYAPENYAVIVGKAYWPDYSEISNLRRVVDIFWRSDFDPATTGSLAYDVAVLKLNAAIASTVAEPIRFVDGAETDFNGIGRTVTVAGWGRTFANDPDGSAQLLSANLRIVSSAECSEWYPTSYIQTVMICATYVGRTACKGDSGGPLFTNEVVGKKVKRKKGGKGKGRIKRIPIYAPVQIGIVSFGREGCPTGVPSVYTRVSSTGVNALIDFALAS